MAKMDRLLRKCAGGMADWKAGMRIASISMQTALTHGSRGGKAELLELRVELGGEREWILFPCPSYST